MTYTRHPQLAKGLPKEDVQACLVDVPILIFPCCHLAAEHISCFQQYRFMPSIC